MSVNYKSCPLKKRPIVYVDIEEAVVGEQVQTEALALTKMVEKPCYNSVATVPTVVYDCDEPQDLSFKRKSSTDIEDYVQLAKRECGLNLSKQATMMSATTHAPLPTSHKSEQCSALLSPPAEFDSTTQYQPTDIHLRGLTAATTGYTTIHPYHSAFVTAAGCNPISALWSNYQPQMINTHSIFPSPASSTISTASLYSGCSYEQHITPPASPDSEECSEAEDLSMRSDIPLPALFHLFDEAPSSSSSMNNSTSAHKRSQTDSTNSASKNYRFKCDKCNKMYSTSMGLSKHQQFHCPAAECNQEKKTHSCEECGKLYTTIGALKMHIRTHTLPCKCPICGKAFSRHWLLQGHIRTHTGEKPYKCPDCPRSFADRSNLRAHQQTHVDIKKYVCKLCNKSFSRMSLLNKHNSFNCAITNA